MDYTLFYFLIYICISLTLIVASINDWRNRKVPIKTWNFVVYVILPLSFIPLIDQIWNGIININNPLQTFAMIYPLFIIGFLFIISSYTKIVHIGGADFIAVTIILITSIPMGLNLPIVFMAFFVLFSIVSVAITFYLRKEGFKIPLIIPISFAYFIAVPVYFTAWSSILSLI
jgi:hypothetical protein